MNMPSATERIVAARDAAGDNELPYISKSRLTAYTKCPRAFYYNYILGIRPVENEHMRKGSRIHLAFELYYQNVVDHYTGDFVDYVLPSTPRELARFLPDEALLYADWLPYIANFLTWELYRASHATTLRDWLPVAIEAEAWDDNKRVPWMGFADAIIPAASVPQVEDDKGVVIVDFKTGKTPDKKYRNKGIYLEGEYYGMLFRDDYQVAGVAGYFPKNNDFIVSPLQGSRRDFIRDQIQKMHISGDVKDRYPTNTGPLCKWGPEDGENQCDYYDLCAAGQEWGAPTDRWDEFVIDVQNDENYGFLAQKYFDGDADSLGYWTWKANQN